MQTLKGVLFLGPGIISQRMFHHLHHSLLFEPLLKLYDSEEYVIIGDGVRDIPLWEIDCLKGRIDSYTRIDIFTHGRDFSGKHVVEVGSELTKKGLVSKLYSLISREQQLTNPNLLFTYEFLELLQTLAPSLPLQVHLWSCFASLAAEYVKFLAAGSILIMHGSKEHHVIIDFVVSSVIKAITRLQENKGYSLPFNDLLQNLSDNIAQTATISIHIGREVYKHSMEPVLKELILKQEKYVKTISDDISLFYKKIQSKVLEVAKQDNQFSNAYFKQADLGPKYGSWYDSRGLQVATFVYSCFTKNVKEIEEVIEVFKLRFWDGVNIPYAKIPPLFAAIFAKDSEKVQLLIEHGADVNVRLFDGSIPAISFAVYKGLVGIVRTLLRNGADINKDQGGVLMPPLFIACKRNDEGMVDLLIEYKVSVNKRVEGKNAIYFTTNQSIKDKLASLMSNDHLTILLNSVSGIYTLEKPIVIKYYLKKICNILEGHTEVTWYSTGLGMRVTDEYNRTTTLVGEETLFNYYLKNPNATLSYGGGRYVFEVGDEGSEHIGYWQSSNVAFSYNALRAAVEKSDTRYIDFAKKLNPQVDVNKKDAYGMPLINVASDYYNSYPINSTIDPNEDKEKAVIKKFIKEGAVLEDDRLPVAIAQKGDVDFFKWLLKHYSKFDLNNMKGWGTPLSVASAYHKKEMFLFLFDKTTTRTKYDLWYYEYLMFLKNNVVLEFCPNDSGNLSPVTLLVSNTYSNVVSKETIRKTYKTLLSKQKEVWQVLYTVAISSKYKPYSCELYDKIPEQISDSTKQSYTGFYEQFQNRIIIGNCVDGEIDHSTLITVYVYAFIKILFNVERKIPTGEYSSYIDNRPLPYINDQEEALYHISIRMVLENINSHFKKLHFSLGVEISEEENTFDIGKKLNEKFKAYQDFKVAYSTYLINRSLEITLKQIKSVNHLGLLNSKPEVIDPTRQLTNIQSLGNKILGELIENLKESVDGLIQIRFLQNQKCVDEAIASVIAMYPAISEKSEDVWFIALLPKIITGSCYDEKVQSIFKPLVDYWESTISPKVTEYLQLHDSSQYCLPTDTSVFV